MGQTDEQTDSSA